MDIIRNYKDSQYRFTNPIRFFKANDPIYYEVDNIPLKQLQENDLWLKDQIFGITDNSTMNRSGFTELKPYVDGRDNIVKVKPGRFTARINDAYNLDPLQVIYKLLASPLPGSANADLFNRNNIWLAGGSDHPSIQATIGKFKEAVQLDLNGLYERAFTWPAILPGKASAFLSDSEVLIDAIPGTDGLWGQPAYPMIGAILWNRISTTANLPGTNGGIIEATGPNVNTPVIPFSYTIRQQGDSNPQVGFARLPAAETAFIKRWRGVARTAIVDVPEELTITIPAFNPQDYFYYNETRQKVLLDAASQRIDLLFIYSKPIDTSSTTIAKFVNGSPQTITEPQLGLVYGAGLGVNFKDFGPIRVQEVLTPAGTNKGQYLDGDDTTLEDGTPKMLSHFGDVSGVNTGFNISGVNIRGSFPSPDDLMNLAPLLDLTLDKDSLPLIGQSILPIAYIVVKKSSQLNEEGQSILTNSDVIDIRPFFRTTELTYNERAGLAAAIPAPSLANPVVTQAELGYEINRVIGNIPQPQSFDGTFPRVVHSNTIQGGWAFGVEGALLSYIMQQNPTLTRDQAVERLVRDYGYTRLEAYPEWDIASWCGSIYQDPGRYPNDRINFHSFKMNSYGTKDSAGLPVYEFAAYSDYTLSSKLKRFGTTPIYDNGIFSNQNNTVHNPYFGYPASSYPTSGNYFIDGVVNLLFVKKRINLDRTRVNWMCDYNVNVQFMNCTPLTSQTSQNLGGRAGNPSDHPIGETIAGAAGLWVEKYTDHFIIYAAWTAKDFRSETGYFNAQVLGNSFTAPLIPRENRSGNHFAGFAVFNKDWVTRHHYHNPGPVIDSGRGPNNRQGESTVGIAIYPTVQFEVVGIPTNFAGRNAMSSGQMYNQNPTIKLA